MFIPVLGRLFQVAPLNGEQVGLIYLLAFCPTVIIQLYKIIRGVIESKKESC